MSQLLVFPVLATVLFATALTLVTVHFEVEEFSEMYMATVQQLEDTTFSIYPRKTMYQVRGPNDVYEWLTKVAVPMLYLEAPVNGGGSMCTEAFPCTMGQGDAEFQSLCAGSLVPGEHNCPSYIASTRHCCEPCSGDNCTNTTFETARYTFTRSTKVTDLSANCADEMPAWLEDLEEWTRFSEESVSSRSAGLIPDYNPKYCPERESTVSRDIEYVDPTIERPLMVGTYNRALLGRLSMKRKQLLEHESAKFQFAYPIEQGGSVDPWSFSDSENTTAFGKDRIYNYDEGQGAFHAGAFVHVLDFAKSEESMLVEIADLKANHWFDLQQGTLVLELVFYNGNVNKFLVGMIVFDHMEGVGLTKALASGFPLDLSYLQTEQPITFWRAFLVVLICFLFAYFLKEESEVLIAGPKAYLTNAWTYLNVLSLGTCAIFLGMFAFLVLRPDYVMFKFPIGSSAAEKAAAMDMIGQSAILMRKLMQVQSFNLLVAFAKLVSQGTALSPSLAIVFKVLGRKLPQMITFMVVMVIFLVGFSSCAYYWFGSRIDQYAGFWDSYLQCLMMVMGASNFSILHGARKNGAVGALYWLSFKVTFLVICSLVQSVIISGYREEREKLANMTTDERKPWRRIAKGIMRQFQCVDYVIKKATSLLELVFGFAASSGRIDEKYVGYLRDKRVHKPRHRVVTYDGRAEDEEGNTITPSNDFELLAERPFYLGGLMQYTLCDVKVEGRAYEAKVAKNWRLVGVQTNHAAEPDVHFRDAQHFTEDFHDDERQLRQWLTDQVSQHGSVILHFTGPVRQYSVECFTAVLFAMFWGLFAAVVARPSKGFSLIHGVQGELERAGYQEYNPTRVSAYEDLLSGADIENWMRNVLVPATYRCSTSLASEDSICDEEAASWSRPGFNLFAHSFESTGSLNIEKDLVDLSVIPQAQEHLSLGYVAPEDNTTLDRVVLHLTQNVGAMPLNHLRLTVQYGCYEQNPSARLYHGYPYLLFSDLLPKANKGCGVRDCMKTLPAASPCYNSQGVIREDPHVVRGQWSGVNYNLVTDGSFRGTGGIVVGFGGTRAEAERVADAITRDHLLKKDVVGAVFQLVSYSPTAEMFAETTIVFNFHPTGKLSRYLHTSSFSLNLMRTGVGHDTDPDMQSLQYSLVFWTTTLLAVLTVLKAFADLREQQHITLAMNRQQIFVLYDYIVEDWWNIVQLCLAFFVVRTYVSMAQIYLVEGQWDFGRLPNLPFSSWAANHFVFNTVVGPDTQDENNTIDKVSVYRTQMEQDSGVVLFLACIHIVKYFNILAPMQLLMATLTRALAEILNIGVIFLLVLTGMVFTLHTSFGIQVPLMFGTPGVSAKNIYFTLVKGFQITVLHEKDAGFFLFFFTFHCSMLLILPNMALAAMVSAWQDTRRHAWQFGFAHYVQVFRRSMTYVLQFARLVARETGAGTISTEEVDMEWLDMDFWHSCSVLNLVDRIGEGGKLDKRPIPREQRLREAASEVSVDTVPKPLALPARLQEPTTADAGLSVAAAEPGSQTSGSLDWLEVLFHKMHMKRAEEITRHMEPSQKDDDVRAPGADDAESSNTSGASSSRRLSIRLASTEGAHISELPKGWGVFSVREASVPPHIPVIDHPVDKRLAYAIKKHLDSKLDVNDVAQELWLDALLTVLDYAGTIDKLRTFFVPQAMIRPHSVLDRAVYKERRDLMTKRLNIFLFWVQQEAQLKFQAQICEEALVKERVLLSQGVVISEHLAELDKQVEELRKEVRDNREAINACTNHLSVLA